MRAWGGIIGMVIASAGLGLPAVAQPPAAPVVAEQASGAQAPPVVVPPITNKTAVLENDKGEPVVVVGRDRHRVMRALFGKHRRRGGLFKNLFHGKHRWRSKAGHNKACKQKYRSFNARTNRYMGYSGVRRVCLI